MIAKGEFAQALPWLERAVQLCETKRVLLCLPAAYVNAGWTLAWLRRSTEGLSYLEQGVTASESIGTKFYSSFAYFAWAEGLLLAGRIPDAKRTADRALELAMTSGEQGNEAGILRLRAEISVCQTPPAFGPAVSLYERAKALAGELGMRPLLAHCHAGLANLSRCTGDRTEAEKHLTAALTMFREMDMRFWLERVQADSRSLS
jgi:tetratricopeptide (TPR) repeat protein